MMIMNAAVYFFLGLIWSKDGVGNLIVKLGFFVMVAANVIFMTWGVK
jgi:hypothetical protein